MSLTVCQWEGEEQWRCVCVCVCVCGWVGGVGRNKTSQSTTVLTSLSSPPTNFLLKVFRVSSKHDLRLLTTQVHELWNKHLLECPHVCKFHCYKNIATIHISFVQSRGTICLQSQTAKKLNLLKPSK